MVGGVSMKRPNRPPVRFVELPEAALNELGAYAAWLLVSKSRGGMVTGDCGPRTVNLLEVGRMVAALHDFSAHRSHRIPLNENQTTAVWSLAIDKDLALCVVLDTADPRNYEAMQVWIEAHKSLRIVLGEQGTNVPIPPATGGGGEGATAIAGVAQYVPKKGGSSN
jgi:hypothetical protein